MKILNRLWRKNRPSRPSRPTPEELEEATRVLECAAKPALLGSIGGMRPDLADITQSWWGGNVLGKEGETAPVDSQTGNPMQPVLQIAVNAMPLIPERLADVALITLWMDLKGYDFWHGSNGSGFVIREYGSLDGLLPISSAKSAALPIIWHDPVMQLPSWEDFSSSIPEKVTAATNDDWFFKNSLVEPFAKLQENCPVKFGGWPTWIQGASRYEKGSFVFQIDTNDKGKFAVGDSGSIYVFKTDVGWVIDSDCF